MRMNSRKPRRGFSLLEMLAVVTILGVLAAVVIPRISSSGVAAKRKMCTHHVSEVNKALERFFLEKGKKAKLVSELNEIDYFPDAIPTCPLTGDGYLIDENTDRVKQCSCVK